ASSKGSARTVPISRRNRSLLIIRLRQFLPVPPPAAQRLEQRGSVRVARGLCLHARDARQVIRLFGAEQGELVDVTVAQLPLRKIERGARGVFGFRRGLQRFGVVLQSSQRVGDVLKCRQHGAAVLLGRLPR